MIGKPTFTEARDRLKVSHLWIPAVLTREQIARYNDLSGYGNSPSRHSPAERNAAVRSEHVDCEFGKAVSSSHMNGRSAGCVLAGTGASSTIICL